MITTKVHQNLIGMTYHEVIDKLEIIEDQGACCGFAGCDIAGEIPDDLDKDHLTLKDCVRIEYDEDYNKAQVVLNFVFQTKEGNELVLGYHLEAGSGSGWGYGAYVILRREGEELASASW